ncbi:hypothetical protein [Kaarinaea lacus]
MMRRKNLQSADASKHLHVVILELPGMSNPHREQIHVNVATVMTSSPWTT